MIAISAPEWVESQGKIKDGLDLLGLRLPVQTISGFLLNGVTTISPRVRYLSIRSWIIKAFSESGLPNESSAVSEFSARVEAAIAYAVLLTNRSALYVPGSTKAGNIIDDGMDPIHIERLIDQTGFNAYAGPSYGIFLSFTHENSVPGLTTERGVPLANQFERLIEGTAFYKAIKENPKANTLSREVLKELGDAIQLDQIPVAEQDLLLQSILPTVPIKNDLRPLRKEINRIGVYTLFLELANRHGRLPTEEDVFTAALDPDPNMPDVLIPILDGYLWYLIRDVLAVIHEAVLGEVCSELGGYDEAVASNRVISSVMSGQVNKALQMFGLLSEGESFEQLRYNELVARVKFLSGKKQFIRGLNRWTSDLDESKIINLVMKSKWAAIGLQPVAWILTRLRVGDYDLKEYPELEILSHQGNARLGLQQVVLPQLNKWAETNPSLDKIIAWQLQRTVDQHLKIAWSRMFREVNKDVAILSSDGDRWQHRGKNYVGDRTASRISQAIGWLNQLDLVSADGLTPKGEDVLEHNYQTLFTHGGEA